MKRLLAILFVGVLFCSATLARAASLTYSAPATLILTSPAVNLTVNAGSVADSVIVKATSVVISLSSSTGGTFTLTSPEALSSSTTGSGGSDAQSCSGGAETDTITQSSASETYTLTPTGSACTTSSGGGGNGGGGVSVGVASAYGEPYVPGVGIVTSSTLASSTTVTANPTIAASTSSLSELNTLEAELAALEAEAHGSSPSGSSSAHYAFTRNLSLWNTGSDVKELQLFLISQASGPAAARLKAHGMSQVFGLLTYNALVEFQKSVGITPAAGYFGPKTRAYINAEER